MAHKDSSREEIIDRAMQLASVCGLEGISIGQLAAAVNMSKGGIGAHFRTKLELQIAVVRRAAEIYRRVLIAPTNIEPEGLPQIKALFKVWGSYMQDKTFEGGCFFTNALLELDDLDESDVKDEVRRNFGAFVQWLVELAKRAVELGHFKKDTDPDLFAFEVEGILSSFIVGRALGHDEKSRNLAKKAASGLIKKYEA